MPAKSGRTNDHFDPKDMPLTQFVEEVPVEDKKVGCLRNMKVEELAEDGSYVKLALGMAINSHNDAVWHPKHLIKKLLKMLV